MLYSTPIDKKQIFEWFDEYMEQREKEENSSYTIEPISEEERKLLE